MAAPATAVVAGFVTLWLAVRSDDGLVADDYYRQGLAINRALDKEHEAARLGIRLRVEPSPGLLRVRLEGDSRPAALTVRLVHSTRAGSDLRLRLGARRPQVYEASLPALPPGHWHVAVQDARATWRVDGDWSGAERPFRLEAAPTKGAP